MFKPKTRRDIAQIASEARQLGRYDSKLVKSLLFQQENMHKEINGGFIKKFLHHLYTVCFVLV